MRVLKRIDRDSTGTRGFTVTLSIELFAACNSSKIGHDGRGWIWAKYWRRLSRTRLTPLKTCSPLNLGPMAGLPKSWEIGI
jgi:hypothetical protein